jgi:hypothetical protein
MKLSDILRRIKGTLRALLMNPQGTGGAGLADGRNEPPDRVSHHERTVETLAGESVPVRIVPDRSRPQ